MGFPFVQSCSTFYIAGVSHERTSFYFRSLVHRIRNKFFAGENLRLLAGNLWGDENNNVNSEAAKKMGKIVSLVIITTGLALLFYAFKLSRLANIVVAFVIGYSIVIIVIVYVKYAKN